MQIDMALAMLRTVDRVSISAIQKTPGTPDVLVQVTGSFDAPSLTGMFPSTGTSVVKAVGPHTILVGEGDSFKRAEARLNSAAALSARPGEMEQSDIWIK